jgi:hypothetical protein
MRRLTIACSAALLALSLAGTARADEWNKLTYLTFSGPVQMPGITLPAGTYRFELADPDTGRRVIRVSDKDGSKIYGTFLSISDQKIERSSEPVVMFKETPSGVPQAVQAWFYPGETYGYEFAYPHDQALKIAKATHRSVLAVKDTPQASTDDERMASMKSAEVTHIDENDRPVSTDEQLKDSSSLHPSNTAATNTTSSNTASTTASTGSSSPMNTQTSTASNTAGVGTPAQASTAAKSNTAQSTTAQADTASRSNTASRSKPARRNNTANSAVGTSGSQAGTATDNPQTNTASRSPRRSLPRTAGELPLLELLSGLAFAGGFSVRAFRRR